MDDMDRLDELEAQSIFIFREAFARLRKLAMLWSLGKDTNVMIWLARKAFFGHVPFPVMHVDTGKKFPEMYAFRDRYAAEWGLDLIVEPCPPIEAVDPTLPPAARSAARKTAGPEARAREARLQRPDRRHPPRRGGDPRQGARVLAARRATATGTSATSRPSSGTSSTHGCRPARICASIRSCIGPRSTSGATRGARASRSSRSISPRDGKRYRSLGDEDITFPVAIAGRARIDEIIAELETTKTPERAGRAMDHEAEDAFERLRAAGYM